MATARGKYAKFISDRSGMAFPYSEMKREWNGSRVHESEFEEKHPQLRSSKHKAMQKLYKTQDQIERKHLFLIYLD